MSSKRILLVTDDKLLLKFYQERLEENDFLVTAAREIQSARNSLATTVPDLVLLDLVFNQDAPDTLIRALRTEPSTQNVPILILPNPLGNLATDAIQAGATRGIQPSAGSPVAAIVDAVRSAMGMPGLGSSADAKIFKADDFWVDAVFANAVDTVNRMRHCLPGVAENPPELETLHSLWNLAHGFAQKAALLPYKPLVQITAALDMLLCDLNQAPEQINPSVLRTLGQVLDFLATISKPECLQKLSDPSKASLLVVDDEDGARTFITSALQLAGLKNDCAASPEAALDKLCTKVRTIEDYKNTPIVFLTGMATFTNKAKASLSGGNDFIGKPFNLPELGVKALMWLCRGQLAMV